MKDNKDVDRLSHTAWRCQYHVVFAPKYRRMVIYDQIKKDIGQILRQLCEQKEIEIMFKGDFNSNYETVFRIIHNTTKEMFDAAFKHFSIKE